MPNQSGPHTRLLNQLLLALGKREDLGKFWKRNTGAAKIGNRFIQFGLPGAADIEGILVNGIHAEIEVKTGSGDLSEQQKNFAQMIVNKNGFFLVAREIPQCMRAIEAFLEYKND